MFNKELAGSPRAYANVFPRAAGPPADRESPEWVLRDVRSCSRDILPGFAQFLANPACTHRLVSTVIAF